MSGIEMSDGKITNFVCVLKDGTVIQVNPEDVKEINIECVYGSRHVTSGGLVKGGDIELNQTIKIVVADDPFDFNIDVSTDPFLWGLP